MNKFALNDVQLEIIRAGFRSDRPAKDVAKELRVSVRCIYQRYERLRGGPLYHKRIKVEKPVRVIRPKRLLPDRFYRSTFNPS